MSKKFFSGWGAVETIAACGIVVTSAYYTYHFGWRGFAYAVLAATLGAMIVYWFGDIIPGLSWLLRDTEDTSRKD